ncbi:exo-alpha-sialidase [Lysobacter sp. SG-8]|uniref:Exo-alpha-sialidase n=1 Tax=Marilutibacter penaei TaxID=2759900 RepID=A0A7W3YF93_9GAMM|nr:sialidase family protein [Lysobacter penaei]MBB1088996.1 exo-alpha-sialidase [Lysobacter penaei]
MPVLKPLAWISLVGAAALAMACSGPTAPSEAVVDGDGTPGAVEDASRFDRIEPLVLPSGTPAAQPDLVAAPDGVWLLSWIEAVGDDETPAHRLRFSRADAGADWSAPRTVAEGDNWFVNWADTPHLYALPDGSLWAHWLRSTGPSRMDYGIDLVRSDDGGATWSAPQLVHLADSLGDHGFVSLWPQADDTLGIAWLDSRQKAAAGVTGHDDGHHGGGAAMMLWAATYDAGATQTAEWPLDVSTCDCCTTDAAVTDRGPVVVYRGRTAEEVRDTRIVRFENGAWTAPHDVHTDGWVMPGCPVNGPVIEARGNAVWVAWFTMADGEPEVRLARSDDAGDGFAAPLTVARGPAVLGRAAMALAGDRLLVAWLEEGDTQSLQLAVYDADDLAAEPLRSQVATLSVRGRASGMPRLAVQGDEARLVWTDVVDGRSVLGGLRIH